MVPNFLCQSYVNNYNTLRLRQLRNALLIKYIDIIQQPIGTFRRYDDA